MITITHDEAIAAQADRVVGLRDGRIVPLGLAATARPLA